jgi:hypothetical protein
MTSIFSAEDRRDMRDAADSLALASIGVEYMVDGIAPKPRVRTPEPLGGPGFCDHGFIGGWFCPDSHCAS